jgi:hypothetical protein
MKKRPPDSGSKEIVSALLENARTVAKPKRVAWRVFNRFVADVERLREYVGGLYELRWGPAQGDAKTAADIEGEAEFCQALVARCNAGLARFDHADNYDEDDDDDEQRVLSDAHIAIRIGILVASFANANPGNPGGYVTMLIEHVHAVEGLSEIALESACREIVETKKFAPTIAEVLSVIKQHIAQWRERRSAIREAENLRLAVVDVLREHEQKRKEQARENAILRARSDVSAAMATTQRLAKEIAAAGTALATLRQRHAESEKHESEAMRRLRALTAPPPEAAEAASERVP